MSKLKEVFKKFFAVVFVLAVIGGTQVYAYSSTSTYYLPKGTPCPTTHAKETATRSVSYRLIDVYPPSGIDTYKKIKLAAYKGNVCLMEETVISESSTITTVSYGAVLNKGDNVTFILNGNDSTKAAYAKIFLDWE